MALTAHDQATAMFQEVALRSDIQLSFLNAAVVRSTAVPLQPMRATSAMLSP